MYQQSGRRTNFAADNEDTITSAQRQRLREDFVNVCRPCDGEVFCNLLKVGGDRAKENEWFTKWDSESKTDLFRQLRRRKEFEGIKESLYLLPPFKGLWRDVEFGTARRWLTLWFPEVNFQLQF